MYPIVLSMSLACLAATVHPWHAKPLRHGDMIGLGSAVLNSSFDNPFNGAFRVEKFVNDTQFLVTLEFDPGANPTGTIQWASQNSTPLRREVDAEGVPFGVFNTDKPAQTGTIFGEVDLVSMFGAVLNGSFVNGYNTVVGVQPNPTARSFKFRIFGADPTINGSGGAVCALAKATPLSVNGTTATFTTVLKHGLVTGQGIKIEDPIKADTPFRGFFAVASVPSQTTFSWEYSSSTGGNGPPGYRFAALWQVGQFVSENNIIELAQTIHPTPPPVGPSWAIGMTSGDFRPQYTFRRVLVRENLIRLIPGAPNPDALALRMTDAEQAIIEKNLVDLENALSMQHERSQSMHYFNSQNPQGTLVQGVDSTVLQKIDELATRVEDAFIFAL